MFKKAASYALSAILLLSVMPVSGMVAEAEEYELQPEGYILCLENSRGITSLSFEPEQISSDTFAVSCPAEAFEVMSLGTTLSLERDEILTLQDAYTATQWSHASIGAEAAWNHTDGSGSYDCRGDGVTVAVIDSGVYLHPDLNSENIIETDDRFDGYTQWHGTFVAGVIAAQLNDVHSDGIAPNVNILSLCITDYSGNTTTSQAVSAIEYAVEKGADVINLSISGTKKSTALENACRDATDAGVIVVACAGNASTNSDAVLPNYPASFDRVISVSSCGEKDGVPVFSDSFSCHNDYISVCAPGENILSLYIDDETTVKSGTSFSAPIVSAMAALAKQKSPDVTSEEFLALLAETSDDYGEPGRDSYFGYGVVNIASFIDAITAEDSVTAPDVPDQADDNADTHDSEGSDSGSPDDNNSESESSDDNSSEGGNSGSGNSGGGRSGGYEAPAAEGSVEGSPVEDEPSEKAPVEDDNTPLPFEDVTPEDYCYDAVRWAIKNGITSGTDANHFSPAGICTRAQMVTFLYRAAGAPEISGKDCPFTDLDENAYYYNAVIWAYRNGITTGLNDTTFGLDGKVTREQVVTFLWRFSGAQQGATAVSPSSEFSDFNSISDYAADAFIWALDSGITAGTSSTTLSPADNCLRGQIVTFLFRMENR